MTAQADTKLQKLECVLLFISLTFPPLIFIPNIFLTPEQYKTPELLYSISTMLSLCSIVLFLPVAILNSFIKLQQTENISFREVAAARITLLLILLAALIVSSFYIMPLTGGSFDPESTEWAPRTVFLVYMALLVYFLFVHLNKISRWIKEKVQFLIAFNIFLFIFSWIIWSIGFSYIDEKLWEQRYESLSEWEGVSELANDLRDFNVMERYLETDFSKKLGIKVAGSPVLLKVIPLENDTIKAYFIDDKGVETVNAYYSYVGTDTWEFTSASEIKLVRPFKLD